MPTTPSPEKFVTIAERVAEPSLHRLWQLCSAVHLGRGISAEEVMAAQVELWALEERYPELKRR